MLLHVDYDSIDATIEQILETNRRQFKAKCGVDYPSRMSSLFACAGAAADRLMVPSFPENGEPLSMDELLPTLRAPSPDWRALLPAKELRTQVLLLESQNPATRQQSSDAIRRTWLEAGSVITAYREALVRVSLPRQELVASS